MPLSFRLQDLFEIIENDRSEYLLKALVCSTGRSYFTAVCVELLETSMWRIYDGDQPILEFENVEEVFQFVVKRNATPELILFETNDFKEREEISPEQIATIQAMALSPERYSPP